MKLLRIKIESISVIRADRVEIAKHQVKCECENLKDEMASTEEKKSRFTFLYLWFVKKINISGSF